MEHDFLKITGGNPLCGKTEVHGAKNAVLPLLAASILTKQPVTVTDTPYITDVANMCEVLSALSLSVERAGRSITVCGSPDITDIPAHLACAMRSSVFMLGALLSVTGEVKLFNPGGCNIGARPLDIHLDGLRRMGAAVEYGGDYVRCHTDRLKGAEIRLKYPSVGATENLLLSAVLANGRTTLVGAAREPEIVSLAHALRRMGARITGDGTPVIKIEGVDELEGAAVTPVPDRIVTGTLLAATAVCGGRIEIENGRAEHLGSVVTRLVSPHNVFVDHGDSLELLSDGILSSSSVSTGPYPLFPTDMQAQFMVCQCLAQGGSRMTETVFENRFGHVGELVKMGARISIAADTALIGGVRKLFGADLTASDLRGGAGLVAAALAAEGESVVRGLRFIDRGYESIENIFSSLGGRIERVSADRF